MKKNRWVSIRIKLLLGFLAVALVPLLGYSAYSINNSEQLLKEQFEKQTQQLLSTNLSDVLAAEQNVIIELSHNPIIKSLDYTKAEPYFKRFIKDNPQYSHILICNPHGTEIAHSEGPKHHGKNIAHKEYFKVPWETGKPVIADATFSTSTGRKIVGLGVPIFDDNGKKIGVVVGFIKLEYISDSLTRKKVTESGYAFMINKEGVYISHPDTSKLLVENPLESSESESFKNIIKKMIKQESGIEETTINGQKMIVNYKPANINGWSLAMVSPVDEVFAVTGKLKNSTYKAVGIIVIILLPVVLFISSKIVQPINNFVQFISSRDFSKTVDSNDELGQAFNSLAGEMKSMLSKISGAVKKLAASADQFKDISENSAAAASDIAGKVQNITSAAQTQEMKVNDLASFISSLNKQLVDITDRLQGTKINSEEAFETAQNGQQLVDNMAQSITTLGRKAEEINSIVDTINGIAEQTNLLALNAAIEAARAGEQGRGFAVVAEEVRKLAAQSSEATRKIGDLVGEIQADIEKVVQIATEKGDSNNVVSAFKEILEKTKNVTNNVLSVVENAHSILEKSETAKTEAINVVELVADTTENTESIAAFTEEQTAAVEELSSSADELSVLAHELQNEIDRFKY
ncbi:MAG: Cache 3/Cache 2 fusion domain-containing protein [Desulfotomaculum sp.]|nr:Cache 3/Cache 2 fusion domain-containing protein [Desulfotomaculum sp.]